ncbi:MAG TPA: hypothetical protein VLA82_07860, partial [Actinomycetota bacterium]|nr:hypothetical protein [Actinomycetota bacterium]
TQLRQDAPVPAGSTMLSALTVHDDGRDGYELTASFTLPSLAPGEYAVGMCSPGCALTGFGEPLTGSFVVAATAREAELLRRNDELTIAAANMERRLKKADRQIVELDEALALAHDARDAAATDARAALAAEGARADAAVAGEERAVDASFRWRVVALVTSGAAIVALSLWLTARRRRPHDATTVPDTPEELLEAAGRR